jgi:16S rRNA (guanine(1405)-N(7))-methyltransferase
MENEKLGFTSTKNQKDFSEDAIKLIIKDILAKRELSNLNEELVAEKLKVFLAKHKSIAEKLRQKEYSKFKRSKEHEAIIKKIRAELREVYGVFIQDGYKKRFGLLEELKKRPSLEIHNKILALHKSSKERLPYYLIIYKKIFAITGTPRKIIDFACGLNPLSYPYLECKPEYLACDLAEKDLEFIQAYFDIMKIKGATQRIDLIKDHDKLAYLSKDGDIAFLFKTLDSLETVQWNISEQILTQIKARFIVVSFATKSLGGKKTIRKEKRGWFERLISKLKYGLESFEIPGEIFYILIK